MSCECREETCYGGKLWIFFCEWAMVNGEWVIGNEKCS